MSKRIKAWAKAPFHRAADYIEELGEFEQAVTFGVSHTGRVAFAEEWFQKFKNILAGDSIGDTSAKPDDSEDQKRIEFLKSRAEAADRQLAQGLPMLHTQMALGFWSILEATMEDFVVAWLMNVEGALSLEEFARVKVPLAQFESMDKEERMRHVLETYQQQCGAKARLGVERFECLLKPLGLSGEVSEGFSKTLFELQQVRNVMLHRGGVADHRLVGRCPWLGLTLGTKVLLGAEDTKRYTEAVSEYIVTVLQRLLKSHAATESRD